MSVNVKMQNGVRVFRIGQTHPSTLEIEDDVPETPTMEFPTFQEEPEVVVESAEVIEEATPEVSVTSLTKRIRQVRESAESAVTMAEIEIESLESELESLVRNRQSTCTHPKDKRKSIKTVRETDHCVYVLKETFCKHCRLIVGVSVAEIVSALNTEDV